MKARRLALWSSEDTPREKTNMRTRTVTANYRPSPSKESVESESVLNISKPDNLANHSGFRSDDRKVTALRTNFMKKLLIYLGGVSLAVLPIQAEAGPHHGGFRGGYHHGHFARGYYRYHRGYYYPRYGHRFFYPGYYPYYGYQWPGSCFTFSFN
jgi:hypothetical protein